MFFVVDQGVNNNNLLFLSFVNHSDNIIIFKRIKSTVFS